jgi:hypothetical protein
MYIYRIKRNTVHHDYSIQYDTKEEALEWFESKGKLLEKVSNRKFILFRNSLRVKDGASK